MESNEQNKLSNDIETDAENRLTDVREEGIGDLVRRVKGLSKKKRKRLKDTDNSLVTASKNGAGGGGRRG